MSDTKVGFDGLVQKVGKLGDIHLHSDGPQDVPYGVVDQTSTTEVGYVKADLPQNAANAPNNWHVKP